VRRHARLVDYRVHEGSNARTWAQVVVTKGVAGVPLSLAVNGFITRFITKCPNVPRLMRPDSADFRGALLAEPQQFELVPFDETAKTVIKLSSAHNVIHFYTWGALACCLPKGATGATLRDALPDLKSGDVLVLVEALGPLTGEPGDADPAKRHAVRLTSVTISSDPLGGRFNTSPSDVPVSITEITWSVEDALPFPLCVSARQGDGYIDDVSVALGNIVLVDQSVTIGPETLPNMARPNPAVTRVHPSSRDPCADRPQAVTLARYRPALKHSPLTHAPAYNLGDLTRSATALMRWPDTAPLPAVYIDETVDGVTISRWAPLFDLLERGPLTDARLDELLPGWRSAAGSLRRLQPR